MQRDRERERLHADVMRLAERFSDASDEMPFHIVKGAAAVLLAQVIMHQAEGDVDRAGELVDSIALAIKRDIVTNGRTVPWVMSELNS